MKKIMLIVLNLFLIFNTVFAQRSNIKTETFEGENNWEWEEIHNKVGDVFISSKDACLVLKTKKKQITLNTAGSFPLDIKRNFSVTYKFIVKKFDENTWFGITIDAGRSYLILNGKQYQAKISGSINSSNRKEKLKLRKGKNIPVTIKVEQKSGSIILYVNDNYVLEDAVKFVSPMFGVRLVSEKQTELKVDEIVIDQVDE